MINSVKSIVLMHYVVLGQESFIYGKDNSNVLPESQEGTQLLLMSSSNPSKQTQIVPALHSALTSAHASGCGHVSPFGTAEDK